jgi:hypothetical protein
MAVEKFAIGLFYPFVGVSFEGITNYVKIPMPLYYEY